MNFAARDAEIRYEGRSSFQEMLEALCDEALDFAVLPIENTTAGSINEAYDLLARMNLALVGEEVIKVEHCLVALEPVSISHIRTYSSLNPAHVSLEDIEGITDLADSSSQPPSDGIDSAKERRDVLGALRQAISETLTERQRTAILAELRGVPSQRLAEILGQLRR